MTSPVTVQSALQAEHPLQIIGVPNAYVAIMAREAGFKALYLSGAGVSNLSFGLPDVGLTTLENVVEETRRITSVVKLPLLVDIDTGWEDVTKTVQELIKAGAAAIHIEDQDIDKKCGHLKGKKIVSAGQMVQRIEQALKGRNNPQFMVIARTDALASEGLENTIKRAQAYEKAGADAIFAEAFTDLKQYHTLREAISIPILANMTEFGKSPYFTVEEFGQAGVDMVLYPLSAARAMNKAALGVLEDIRQNGTQKSSLDKMQTRQELYGYLKYENR